MFSLFFSDSSYLVVVGLFDLSTCGVGNEREGKDDNDEEDEEDEEDNGTGEGVEEEADCKE